MGFTQVFAHRFRRTRTPTMSNGKHIRRCCGFIVFLLPFVLAVSGHQRNQRGSEKSKLPDNKQQQRRQEATTENRPNVLFIVCDDLNDYVETLGGHPQAITPNIRRLMETSVSFTQAHSNIALCKASRSSFLSGLYPHTSEYLNPKRLPRPEKFEGLKNQRTLIEHFNENGYVTLGTGKIYHGYKESYWQRYGHREDYGPFVYNKTLANDEGVNDNNLENLPHPLVPEPFSYNGPLEGSFGPLRHLGNGLGWRTGSSHRGFREIKFHSGGQDDRDMTADEQSAAWAVEQLQEMDAAAALSDGSDGRPFFLGVGLVRPHTPLVVSKKYFDMYPLETLELPPSLLSMDNNDTLRHTVRTRGTGQSMYHDLIESYSYRKTALRRYLQAYLASVTAADDLLGEILSALDKTRFKDNTIVVFTSDHGYQVGQKDYLGKNLLWQATTRVPLIMRVPGMTTSEPATTASSTPRNVDQLVTLVDLYPTLVDLCGLSADTAKNSFSRPLDGHSLRPFLEESNDDSVTSWDGPDFALSALAYDWEPSDPIGVSLSARYDEWRYIRYSNGEEELYDIVEDPYEWTNLAFGGNSTIDSLLEQFRSTLFEFVNKSKT